MARKNLKHKKRLQKLEHKEKKLENKKNKLTRKFKQEQATKKVLSSKLQVGSTGKKKRKFYIETVPNQKDINAKNSVLTSKATHKIHEKISNDSNSDSGKTLNTELSKDSLDTVDTTVRSVQTYSNRHQIRKQKNTKNNLKKINYKQTKTSRKIQKIQEKKLAIQANQKYKSLLKSDDRLRNSSTLNKLYQKHKLKREYVKAYRHEKGYNTTLVKRVVNSFTDKSKKFIKKRSYELKDILMVLLTVMIVTGSFFSIVMSLFQSSSNAVVSTTYMSSDYAINQADLYFSELETDLYIYAINAEQREPGYDKYVYHVESLTHNPIELISYLSAKHIEFEFENIKLEIYQLFNTRYKLYSEVKTEKIKNDKDEDIEVSALHTYVSTKYFSSIVNENLTSDEKELYNSYLSTYGGRQVFANPFGTNNWVANITSHMGYRLHPIQSKKHLHTGLDIGYQTGTQLHAIIEGTVTRASDYQDGYGNCIIIENKQYKILYAHCDSINVRVGQSVKIGDKIGTVGNTGNSTGSHLHLEVYIDNERLNPIFYVDRGNQNNYQTGNSNLSPDVLKHEPLVDKYCQMYGVIEYKNYILAIMQIESGGTAVDVMQSSESLGLPPNTLGTEESIQQGVKYFSQLLATANSKGCDINSVVQSYNFGGGYLSYVERNGGIHTFKLAENFSRDKAKGVQVSYNNPIAIDINGGYRYAYGNMFYVMLVNQYLSTE